MENQLQLRNQQTAITIKQLDRVFTLTDLFNNFPRLAGNEERIIEARQKGIAFLDMTEKEASAAVTGIIFKVSVICGCQLPTHDAHINALEAEFLNFLEENGYGVMTVEEVLLAFRLNAAFKLNDRVEIYGAVFNIDYAGKVLKQYLNERWRLDSKLCEKHHQIESDKIFEEKAMARRIRIKDAFAKFLEGEQELNLTDLYMQLKDDGAFLDKNLDDRFLGAVRGYKGSIAMTLEGWGEKMQQRFEAGKKAVMALFEAMKSTGKTEIYSDDWQLIHKDFDLPKRLEVPESEF